MSKASTDETLERLTNLGSEHLEELSKQVQDSEEDPKATTTFACKIDHPRGRIRYLRLTSTLAEQT